MANFQKSLDIVIAEDDEDDYLLIAEALKKEGTVGFIHWVKDGEELLNYLDTCDKLDNSPKKPQPNYPWPQYAQKRWAWSPWWN